MLTYQGNVITKHTDVNNWINVTPPPDPYNPLGLPPNTMRCKFKSGYTPPSDMGDKQTLVDAVENIWDIYRQSNVWNRFLQALSSCR
jgi:hypothetical protein